MENQGFKEQRRRWVKKLGKKLFRSLFSWLGKQSLVGDKAFFDTKDFPWAVRLEENFEVIRNELYGLLDIKEHLPYMHTISTDQKKLSKGGNWRAFFLMGFGYKSDQSWKRCPETMKILQTIPNIQSAFFSFLAPQNYIPPHRGITKGIIRCHLAIKVPDQRDQLALRVGDEKRHWEEGRCLVFDDTLEHEVWNKTDQERIVLLIDVERPMKFLGRMVARGLIFGIQRTAYVQEARKNLDNWENYFENATAKAEQP